MFIACALCPIAAATFIGALAIVCVSFRAFIR